MNCSQQEARRVYGGIVRRSQAFVAGLIGILALAGAGCANDPDRAAEEVRRLRTARKLARVEFTNGGFDAALERATDGRLGSLGSVLEKELGRELTRRQKDKLLDLFRRVLLQVHPPEVWEEALLKVYVKHLSLDEMESILKFYETRALANLVAGECLPPTLLKTATRDFASGR